MNGNEFLTDTPRIKELNDLAKKLGDLENEYKSKIDTSHLNYKNLGYYVEGRNQEIVSLMDTLAEQRQEKEDNEEAYRKEMIRSLNAIEQNTANLQIIVELISKSVEQQDVLIGFVTEIMSIAKAKNKEEAKTLYEKTVGRISTAVQDGEALAKLVLYATVIYNMVSTALGG